MVFCIVFLFAYLNTRKIKSGCLLKRGTSLWQASVHFEFGISRQMKAKWFETQEEKNFLWTDAKDPSPSDSLIYKQVPLSDTNLPSLFPRFLPPSFLLPFFSPSLPPPTNPSQ